MQLTAGGRSKCELDATERGFDCTNVGAESTRIRIRLNAWKSEQIIALIALTGGDSPDLCNSYTLTLHGQFIPTPRSYNVGNPMEEDDISGTFTTNPPTAINCWQFHFSIVGNSLPSSDSNAISYDGGSKI